MNKKGGIGNKSHPRDTPIFENLTNYISGWTGVPMAIVHRNKSHPRATPIFRTFNQLHIRLDGVHSEAMHQTISEVILQYVRLNKVQTVNIVNLDENNQANLYYSITILRWPTMVFWALSNCTRYIPLVQ